MNLAVPFLLYGVFFPHMKRIQVCVGFVISLDLTAPISLCVKPLSKAEANEFLFPFFADTHFLLLLCGVSVEPH